MPSIRAPDHGRQVPREKSLRGFDFEGNPSIDPAVVHTLAKCEWVKKGQPLCLIGDSGTGKSHLLIALGTEAVISGFRVKCTLATKLGQRTGRGRRREDAVEDHRALRTGRSAVHRRTWVHAAGPLRRELLFEVLTEREEQAPSRSR